MRGTNTRADRAMAYLRVHGVACCVEIAEHVNMTANNVPTIMQPFVDDRTVIRELVPHPKRQTRPIIRYRLSGVKVFVATKAVRMPYRGQPAGPTYSGLLARELMAANEKAKR